MSMLVCSVLLSVCQSQHREGLLQAREMTLGLVQVRAEPWHWVHPGTGTFLWDTTLGHVLFSRLFLVSSQQFLCVPTREQPQHRVVVSKEMDCRAECEVKSIFPHPFQPYPLIPNLS